MGQKLKLFIGYGEGGGVNKYMYDQLYIEEVFLAHRDKSEGAML